MLTIGADQYEHNGYFVCVGATALRTRERARRLFLLALREYGVSAEQIAEWSSASWYPHLRWEPEVLDLIPREVVEGFGLLHPSLINPQDPSPVCWWGTPQIVVRLPDTDEDCERYANPTPHVDVLPEWATDSMHYPAVFGVAVTDSVVRVWRGSHLLDAAADAPTVDVHFKAGDVLVMDPSLQHASLPNPTGAVRCVVYFRPIVLKHEPVGRR